MGLEYRRLYFVGEWIGLEGSSALEEVRDTWSPHETWEWKEKGYISNICRC